MLVAIAIPIFTTQLEKSREAVDASNIRAAYAEVASASLLDNETKVYKEVVLKQKQDYWQNTQNDFPDNLLNGLDGTTAFTPANNNGFTSTNKNAYVYYKPAAAGTAGGTFHIAFAASAESGYTAIS